MSFAKTSVAKGTKTHVAPMDPAAETSKPKTTVDMADFDPAAYQGTLAVLTPKQRRAVRAYRKTTGYKAGVPVFDIRGMRRLIYLRPGRGSLVRCTTPEGLDRAQREFKLAVDSNPMAIKGGVLAFITRADIVKVNGADVVHAGRFEALMNTPETAKDYAEAKAVEKEYDTAMAKASAARERLAAMYGKFAARLQAK